MQKNDEYIALITGTGASGEGVCRVDGEVVFVPYALLGEKVKIHIVKVLKSHAYAKLIQVITPSPHRKTPECPVFYKCGGCSLQHCDYEYELEFKTNKVRDCIRRIGGLDIPVLPCEPSPETEGYRNKGLFSVTPDGIGFFSPRSHSLVRADGCIIQNKNTQYVIDAIYEYMAQCRVPAYDEASHTGTIRGIFVRTLGGKMSVCVISRTSEIPEKERLVKMLRLAGANSVILNVNPNRTNVPMGKTNITLCGSPVMTDEIGGITFEISPASFYQINSLQTKRLYDYAISALDLDETMTVFDLYCGIGTISLCAARHVKKVVGVEVVPEAVENARKNAGINKISNAEFLCAKAENAAQSLGHADAVIIDPPRKGCDPGLIRAIGQINPEKIMYISCNPATLARDLKQICEYGYTAVSAQPFDMFPKTFHVETAVLLTKYGGGENAAK